MLKKEHTGASRLLPKENTANGRIKTDRYLRVEGKPNIFIAGDATNLPEGRLAIIAGFHTKSVVGNLKTLLSSDVASMTKLKPYKLNSPGKGMGKMMIVTLGRKDGLTSLPFGQFRVSFMARTLAVLSVYNNKFESLNPSKIVSK